MHPSIYRGRSFLIVMATNATFFSTCFVSSCGCAFAIFHAVVVCFEAEKYLSLIKCILFL